MPDKTFNEQINKKDLDLILEVNRKAIEIETAVTDQNEEIIDFLAKNKEKQEKMDENINDKLDELIKLSEDMNKNLFRIQVLFITGVLSLVLQLIQIFFKH